MANEFFIKQNDSYPLITESLSLDGTPIDLTGATVLFRLRNAATGATKINAAATIADAETGLVQYSWTGTDTDTSGTFLREWQVTLASGKILTVPNDRIGYEVIIYDDIA